MFLCVLSYSVDTQSTHTVMTCHWRSFRH